MQNLRDKLLKAGLVTKEQTEAAEIEKARKREEAKQAREPRREAAPRRNDSPRGREDRRPHPPTPRAEAPIPRLPPLALPGSKAFQRLESLKQVELDRKIREMVKASEVQTALGEVRFHFMTRKGKLRRLELTPEQAKLLEEGKLAVVERPEPGMIEHSLVPREAAEQLLALSQKAVRFYNREGTPIGFLTDEELLAEPSSEPEANEAEAASAEGEAAGDEANQPDAAGDEGKQADAAQSSAAGAEAERAEGAAAEAPPDRGTPAS